MDKMLQLIILIGKVFYTNAEFVKLYIDFYFNQSIVEQFKSFQIGFDHVMKDSALSVCFIINSSCFDQKNYKS